MLFFVDECSQLYQGTSNKIYSVCISNNHFRILPLSDPSGTNKKGLINAKNIITIDEDEPYVSCAHSIVILLMSSATNSDSNAMDVDQPKPKQAQANRYHRQFWGFIHNIQDPRRILAHSDWANFVRRK